MFFLNTDSIELKVPSRFVNDGTDLDLHEAATIIVSFGGKDYLCKALSPYAARHNRGIEASDEEKAEWLELISNHDVVMRNISLYAVPSREVYGAGRFALGMIDLCLDDTSEIRYFVHALNAID
jgi:hypothetical protein